MESRKQRMIESLAYYFYLADGCPEGRALQHWLQAQALVEAKEEFDTIPSLESNIVYDKAVEDSELVGLFAETRCN
jgi:hypothetical protein